MARVDHASATSSTQRVNLTSGGLQANGQSRDPSLASEPAGFFGLPVHGVAYESDATNLVAGDANGAGDVFVAYSDTPNPWHAAARIGGSGGSSSRPVITRIPDPDRVVFDSSATNLVPLDTNGFSDVFLWQSGISMLSKPGSGFPANGSRS